MCIHHNCRLLQGLGRVLQNVRPRLHRTFDKKLRVCAGQTGVESRSVIIRSGHAIQQVEPPHYNINPNFQYPYHHMLFLVVIAVLLSTCLAFMVAAPQPPLSTCPCDDTDSQGWILPADGNNPDVIKWAQDPNQCWTLADENQYCDGPCVVLGGKCLLPR